MLARRVAAALDVGTLLALRAEIVDLLIAMPETINWRPLRKHAHALRWHAELIVGELLILMKARGERERGGGYFRGRSKPTRNRSVSPVARPGGGKHVRVLRRHGRSM